MGLRSVTCYPQPSKLISSVILTHFAEGAKGVVSTSTARKLEDGPAAFYGVIGIEHLLAQARASGRDWYYGDNSFFDCARGAFYRFGKNRFQIDIDKVKPDLERLSKLSMPMHPWKKDGDKVVIVEQSEHFFNLSCAGRDWVERVTKELKLHTERKITVRRWGRDKKKAGASLRAELKDAWATVTHMSAAANESVMFGVPVFTTGPCAATPMGLTDLSRIESPQYEVNREEWAAKLAASQWTLEEIRNGLAWRMLNG